MADEPSERLVPDELWALVEPLEPAFTVRPQGGGTPPVDEWAVLTAAVFVPTSVCAWRMLPPSFGISGWVATTGSRSATTARVFMADRVLNSRPRSRGQHRAI